MPRLRERIPTEADSPASRLRKTINPGRPTKGQRIPGSGRRRGQPNHIPKYSQAVILEALETFGRDGRGKDGIIGFIHRALHEDVKHGISLLLGITPKLLEASIVRTEVRIETVQQLDASLQAVGLPPTNQLFNGEVFKLDYQGAVVPEEDNNQE
jgi:hypothetical protein